MIKLGKSLKLNQKTVSPIWRRMNEIVCHNVRFKVRNILNKTLKEYISFGIIFKMACTFRNQEFKRGI
jgi:hypothetical protein